jgi:hypothetical protein
LALTPACDAQATLGQIAKPRQLSATVRLASDTGGYSGFISSRPRVIPTCSRERRSKRAPFALGRAIRLISFGTDCESLGPIGREG